MHDPARPFLAWLSLALAIAFAASPFLVPDFAGFDPDLFPIPQKNPPVQPAGYAFGIWGLIYVWLILGSAWGALRAPRDGPWHDMRKPLALSLALGCGWLWVATLSPLWASLLIWIMLLAALAALVMAPGSNALWAAWPVGLYAGWLSAASCVSLGLLLAGFGWLDQTTAALISIGLAIMIAGFVQAALRRTPTYGIAVIWALIAIIIANWPTTPIVAYVAAAGVVLLLVPTLKALRQG